MKLATKDFIHSRPTGRRMAYVKGVGWVLVGVQVAFGVHRAVGEYDPNDPSDPYYSKTALKAVWYSSGLADVHDVLLDSDQESMQQFLTDLRAGKNPNIVWYQAYGTARGFGRLAKTMTVDQLYNMGMLIPAGADVLWQRRGAGQAAAAAADARQRVAVYRAQTLGAVRRRLEGLLARARARREEAQRRGDARAGGQAAAEIKVLLQALGKVKSAQAAEGSLDQRVQNYKDALAFVHELLYDAERGRLAEMTRTIVVDKDTPATVTLTGLPTSLTLPTLPDRPTRGDVVRWCDDCIAILQRGKATDPERVANRKACLALTGKPRKMPCRNSKCDFSGRHYWFGDRWSCPVCETCTMPSDLPIAGGGMTFRQFAQYRIKLYDDRIAAVRRRADELLQQFR